MELQRKDHEKKRKRCVRDCVQGVLEKKKILPDKI
jgi:hypothetical protein